MLEFPFLFKTSISGLAVPHRLMANIDAALEQNIFYLPKRQWTTDVHHTVRRITSGELLK